MPRERSLHSLSPHGFHRVPADESRVGQVSGSVRVEEKTTFDIPVSSSTPSSPLAAKPDISR